MEGTFEKNRKNRKFCFIIGEDGIKYFCHRSKMTENDWEYTWDGNKCQFIPSKDEKGGEHLLATCIVPHRIPDPLKEQRRKNLELELKNREIKLRRQLEHEQRMLEQERKKAAREAEIEKFKRYTVGIKDDVVWKVMKPVRYYKTSKECNMRVKQLNKIYPKERFRIMKVIRCKLHGQIMLRELTSKNNIGKQLDFKEFKEIQYD